MTTPFRLISYKEKKSNRLLWCILGSSHILYALTACGMLVSHTQFSYNKGNNTIVLMHSGIVNKYPLLCETHTVSKQHRGNVVSFLFFQWYFFFQFFFSFFFSEEATCILQKAFQVGIKKSIDTSSFISESLQVLNLHCGSVWTI